MTCQVFLDKQDILLRAALNRIAVRLGRKIISSTEELVNIAKEAPNRIQSEWDTFKEEVMEESERIASNKKAPETSDNNSIQKENNSVIQKNINDIRQKMSELNRKIEREN